MKKIIISETNLSDIVKAELERMASAIELGQRKAEER